MPRKAKARARKAPAKRARAKPAKRGRRAKPAKRAARKAKRAVRRAKPAAAAKAPRAKPAGQLVGRVSHYFTHISVAVIELTSPLKEGDRIRVQGATTNFEQPVSSMQIEHRPVLSAGPGDSIGLKVRDRVRQGDTVYRL